MSNSETAKITAADLWASLTDDERLRIGTLAIDTVIAAQYLAILRSQATASDQMAHVHKTAVRIGECLDFAVCTGISAFTSKFSTDSVPDFALCAVAGAKWPETEDKVISPITGKPVSAPPGRRH